MTPDGTAFGRILIVNVNWIGDVLFSTPALRAVKKKYPGCFLACLVPPRAAEVLQGNPYVDRVLTYHDRLSAGRPIAFVKTVLNIRKMNFDLALLFHGSSSKAFLTMAAGIPNRWGFFRRGRRGFLTRASSAPQTPVHKVDYFLKLVNEFGIPSDGRSMDFIVPEEPRSKVRTLLNARGIGEDVPYAVIHAGGNWPLKRWPAEYFSQWIKLFKERYPRWGVVLSGVESEKALAQRIIAAADEPGVVSVCGELALAELGALLSGARLVLSNDSGPIHVAASQKAPILGIYGPTLPELTGPISEGKVKILRKDVGCQVPCYFRECDYRVCMDLVTPEQVLQAAGALAG